MYFYLIIGILCSSSLFVAFKLFNKFEINSFNAIVINYITAFLLAFMMSNGTLISVFLHADWMWHAVALGLIFIILFNVMAKSSQEAGVAITSVANKMSFIGPILFGIFYLEEDFSIWQKVGVTLAIGAVFLSSYSKSSEKSKAKIFLPIVLFFGGVLLDTILGATQTTYVKEGETLLFTGSIFGVAAVLGLTWLVINSFKSKDIPKTKDLVAGIILGIPNFLSIFLFLSALEITTWDSAQLFPTFNLSVIVVNAIVGFFFFKEKLNLINYIGITLATTAIALIIFG